MGPQATAVLSLNAVEEGDNGDGCAIRFIPLILSFSQPGEGTLARYVTVIVNRGTEFRARSRCGSRDGRIRHELS